jgi:hypothetical protein
MSNKMLQDLKSQLLLEGITEPHNVKCAELTELSGACLGTVGGGIVIGYGQIWHQVVIGPEPK